MKTVEFIYALIFSAILIVPFIIWVNDKRSTEEFNEKYPCSTVFNFSIKLDK